MNTGYFVLQEGGAQGATGSAGGVEGIAAEFLEEQLVLVNLYLAEEELGDSVRISIADARKVCDD